MKNILSTMACIMLISVGVNADMLKIEGGAGTWMQEPSGIISYTDSGITAEDNSAKKGTSQVYVWAYIKHYVPIIPNFRVEYVSLENKGKATGKFKDFDTRGSAVDTKMSMTQIDVIPYYNILDNSFWITVDLGVDFKIVDLTYEAQGVSVFGVGVGFPTNYSKTESVILPLGYIRGRVELPTTDIGVEADVKYISYDGATIYDVRAKVDYTIDFFPIIQPAVEVGYRIQKFEYDDDDGTKVNLEFEGIYIGINVRY